MLLQLLDILECPICKAASRLWKLKGELTDTRITNGEVICPNDHVWIVKEEILRFDKEKSDERMQFLDHPRTGFQNEVGEQERFDFFNKFEEAVKKIEFDEDDIIAITGDPILFMKYLKKQDGRFLLVYPDEGTLRQLQEISVKKRMYDQVSFVRNDSVGYIGNVKQVNLFANEVKKGLNFILEKRDDGKVLWQGEKVNLVYIEA